jgi:WD40 repeat protein
VFALDFKQDATQFATGGKDTVVRIYDEQTKQCLVSMERGQGYGPMASTGHSNRVFSVKFHPGDPNVVLSGGWDNTVLVWDARTGTSVRSIYGPHLCGDSLDIQGDVVLTGSHRSGPTALQVRGGGGGGGRKKRARERRCRAPSPTSPSPTSKLRSWG